MNRPEITFEVEPIGTKAAEAWKLLKLLEDGEEEQTTCKAIVYAMTRRNCVDCLEEIKKQSSSAKSLPVAVYHGGVTNAQRSKIEQEFAQGKIRMIIATSAFGMGIDCRGLDRVIHLAATMSSESYSKETGRAGRGGSSARATFKRSLDPFRQARP